MRRSVSKFVLFLVAWAAPAVAQQLPAVREGEPIVRTTLTNNRLSMADAQDGFPIIVPRDLVFDSLAPGVTGSVTLQEQPDGFDLICTFRNNGAQPARLGRVVVGKFNLGNNIEYRDFRHVGEPVRADWDTYAFQAFQYPHSLYSPVWALQSEKYAIGISLQYPIMDYRHDTRVLLGSSPAGAPESEGPRGWFVEFRFANLGDESPMGRVLFPGSLAGGEERRYVVSLRVTKNTAEWIRTLTPYRDYFRSMYGGVRYQRDARPIRPILVALQHLITPDNPYGFEDFQNKRPDRNGFRPWADHIKASPQWQRVMLWAPTGLYDQNMEMNFPFQFTTRWQHEARMASVNDPNIGLASLGRANISLGLWWGRSMQVAREWNTAQWEALDPDNPVHVQAAFAEMDGAVQAGAKEIGLDTFHPSITPLWRIVPWLERLREAYPQVKFGIEPITCDIMHRLGPTFVLGWTAEEVRQESDLFRLNNPFYLADLLLPGHESWGAMSYHVHLANKHPVTPELVQADMERIAANGFVPMMFTDPPAPQGVRAAESWMTSLPLDVLRGSGWNLNSSTQGHRQPNGQLVIIADNDPKKADKPAEGEKKEKDGVPAGDAPKPGGKDPAPPGAPIARKQKKYHIDLKVHHDGEARTGDAVAQSAPAEPTAADVPGGKNSVSLPSGVGGTGGKGRATPAPAWLDVLARKGYFDASKINRAINKVHSSSGAQGNVLVVPSGK